MSNQSGHFNVRNSGIPGSNNPGLNSANQFYQANPAHGLPSQQPFVVPQGPDISLNVLNFPPENQGAPMINQSNYLNNSASFNRQGSFNRDVGYYEIDPTMKSQLYKANTIDFVEPTPRFTPISNLPQSKSFDTRFSNAPDQSLPQNRLNQSMPGSQGDYLKAFRIFDDQNSNSFPNKLNISNNSAPRPNQMGAPNPSYSQQYAPIGVSNSQNPLESGVINKFTDKSTNSDNLDSMFMQTNQSINFKNGFL